MRSDPNGSRTAQWRAAHGDHSRFLRNRPTPIHPASAGPQAWSWRASASLPVLLLLGKLGARISTPRLLGPDDLPFQPLAMRPSWSGSWRLSSGWRGDLMDSLPWWL